MTGLTFEIKPAEEPSDPKVDCKGLLFRVRESRYRAAGDTIAFRREYRFLKKKSCPGCNQCGYLWDDLAERNYEVIDGGNDGDIVQLRVTNISTDWETGYADDWDLGMFPQKQEPAP